MRKLSHSATLPLFLLQDKPDIYLIFLTPSQPWSSCQGKSNFFSPPQVKFSILRLWNPRFDSLTTQIWAPELTRLRNPCLTHLIMAQVRSPNLQSCDSLAWLTYGPSGGSRTYKVAKPLLDLTHFLRQVRTPNLQSCDSLAWRAYDSSADSKTYDVTSLLLDSFTTPKSGWPKSSLQSLRYGSLAGLVCYGSLAGLVCGPSPVSIILSPTAFSVSVWMFLLWIAYFSSCTLAPTSGLALQWDSV